MKRRVLFLASAALGLFAGCGEGEVSDYTGYVTDYSGWSATDADDDGWDEDDDCDDADPDVNPGATEICDDGIDNDCDDLTDEDDTEDCG